jgi:Flp pilus assembly protein TadG
MATLKTIADRDERGQAVIELALTLPLLLLVVLGIFDFGFMFQKYEVVTNAAREGARVGVLPGYTPTDAVNRALNYLDVGGLGGAAITTLPPPCGGSVVANTRCAVATPTSTTLPAVGGAAAKTVDQISVVVEFDYEFSFVGPLMNVFGTGLGTTRLRSVSTMRIEPN